MNGVLLLFVIPIIIPANSYVLVQVRKGDNNSDIDALIHKTVPSDKINEFSDQMAGSRKKLNNLKRFEVKKRAGDLTDVDNVLFALDTGAVVNEKPVKPDGIDRIEQIIRVLTKVEADEKSTLMRARDEYNIKPEIVHFRSEKPTLKFEINTKSIVKALSDFLSSKMLKNYAEQAAQKAAVVYRAIKDEMRRSNDE